MSSSVRHFYEFGPFRIDVANRLLLRDGKPLPLTPKAVETLLALVQHGGEVLKKDDLIRLVWPNSLVEQGNLNQHIYLLRKTLSEGSNGQSYIETLPRRGYRFVGDVRELTDTDDLMLTSRSDSQVVADENAKEIADHPDAVGFGENGHRPASLSRTVSLPRSPSRRMWLSWPFLLAAVVLFAIASLFYLKLSGKPKPSETKAATPENSEAYQAYVRGRSHWRKGTTPALEAAVEDFEQALRYDSNYALAYAGLADAYANLADRYDMDQHQRDALPKAKAAATRALQLNDQLAEAHAALAVVKQRYDWDWPGAESEFTRAIQLNPNYAYAHQQYAFCLAGMGRRNDAETEIKRAQELAPQSFSINKDFGEILCFGGDYQQAINQFRRTLDMDASDPLGISLHRLLGWAYEERGMHEQAVAEFIESLRLQNVGRDQLSALRQAYDAGGTKGYWRKWVELRQERIKIGGISPFLLAQVYALLGEKDKAFASLEKAYDEHCVAVAALRFGPTFDDLRSDPRYAALLQRMKLTP